MKQANIASQLNGILPERLEVPILNNPTTQTVIDAAANAIVKEQEAKEIARIKFSEKQKLRTLEEKQSKAESIANKYGLDKAEVGLTESRAQKIAEQRKRVKAIEAIEAETVEPLDITNIAKNSNSQQISPALIQSALRLQGPSRGNIAKLLASLNINLSVQLSKQDTANLLACLLTCNESQLLALQNNKKVPIVIKTVIKRLLEDMKLGNIETIEKLWDRVFGKGAMTLNLPEQQQLETGILPNTPISREAYIVIRDTLLK